MSGAGQHEKRDAGSITKPLSPTEVSGYFDEFNRQTGGRLGTLAREGSPQLQAQALSLDDIRDVAGLNAVSRVGVQEQQRQIGEQIGSNAGLSTFQQQNAYQQADQQAVAATDALSKESEQAIASLMSQQNQQQLKVQQDNAAQALEDLALLGEIYFGGTGARSLRYDRTKQRQMGGGMGNTGKNYNQDTKESDTGNKNNSSYGKG